MIRQRFGRIINISSMAVGLYMPGASAYIASKSAVEDFTKVLAKELGPSGITCNVIALSLVDTDMMDSLKHEVVEKYMQSLVFNRKTEMKDICNAVEFFASPSSGYITGQILRLGFVD
jgi:3-oxoacyl-[acyl-carrier protein] reductase